MQNLLSKKEVKEKIIPLMDDIIEVIKRFSEQALNSPFFEFVSDFI